MNLILFLKIILSSSKLKGTDNAAPEQIIEAAKEIYKDYPELLKGALENLGL